MTGYIAGPDHSTAIETALNGFHRALTRRWRTEAIERVRSREYQKTFYLQSRGPFGAPEVAHFQDLPVVHHVNGGYCSFVDWVDSGQDGSPGSISCDGDTGVREDDVILVDGERGGQEVAMPRSITCPIGDLLAAVEEWAWGERDYIFRQVPMFDSQNVSRLDDAHQGLKRLGKKMGLTVESGSERGMGSEFGDVEKRAMVAKVEEISDREGVNRDWLETWTGLSADRFKEGFASSTARTLHNQSGLLGCIMNCYAERAAIIERGRNNTLYWIGWATEGLDATETVTHDLVSGWKTVQGIGTAISIGGGWSGFAGAVGAGVILVGFMGENLLPEVKTEGLKHTVAEVLEEVDTRLTALKDAIGDHESDYLSGTTGVRNELNGIHSFNLELYDLTENSGGSDAGQGYGVNPNDVLLLSKNCYEAADYYEEALSDLLATTNADADLSDADGEPTAADTEVVALRDELISYLRTTCSRYILAGEQLEAAAESYAQTDGDAAAAFERGMEDWDYDAPQTDFNPETEADATDRGNDSRYDDHPALDGVAPGEVIDQEREELDPSDYNTEKQGDIN